MKLSLLFFHIVLIFSITACGYKPSSQYTKEQLDGKVFVNLIMDLEDPRNTVLIKDAMNELLIHRLSSKLVHDRSLADTIMNVKLDSVSMSVLQDDDQGNSKLYRATVKILVDYKNKKGSDSFTVEGDDEFSLDDGTTITDTKRFVAIKNASAKALQEVISKIAVNTFKKK